ncbi:hypothetical protein MNV49_006964 [Pseudohyphozyma bogoriensis]|nr:hypothetical protein MNV49_006964 [Pseudohyphozyma bogoriensis]
MSGHRINPIVTILGLAKPWRDDQSSSSTGAGRSTFEPSLYDRRDTTRRDRKISNSCQYHGYRGFPGSCDEQCHMIDYGPSDKDAFKAKIDLLEDGGIVDESWYISHPSNLYPMDPTSHKEFDKRHVFAMVPVDEDLDLLLAWIRASNVARQLLASKPAFALGTENGPRIFKYRFIVLRDRLLCDPDREQFLYILPYGSSKAEPYKVKDFEFVSVEDDSPLPDIPHVRPDPTTGLHDPVMALNPILVLLNAFGKFEYFRNSTPKARLDQLPLHVKLTMDLVDEIVDALSFQPQRRTFRPSTIPPTIPSDIPSTEPPTDLPIYPFTASRAADPCPTPLAETTPRAMDTWEDDDEEEAGVKASEAPSKAKAFYRGPFHEAFAHDPKARRKMMYAILCSPPIEDSDDEEDDDEDDDDDSEADDEDRSIGWRSESDDEDEER